MRVKRAGFFGQSQLETQTRLLRDGKPAYEGKVNELQMVTGGTMKLGSQMASGDYVLQVIGTDKPAKATYRTATQWMNFEVE